MTQSQKAKVKRRKMREWRKKNKIEKCKKCNKSLHSVVHHHVFCNRCWRIIYGSKARQKKKKELGK